jgi:hypothetical protein
LALISSVIALFPDVRSSEVRLTPYIEIPLSTVEGDFQKPKIVLFYTKRTEGYSGKKIEGIDEIFEMTGDFVSATGTVKDYKDSEDMQKDIDAAVKKILQHFPSVEK